jgi:hypothetical protein
MQTKHNKRNYQTNKSPQTTKQTKKWPKKKRKEETNKQTNKSTHKQANQKKKESKETTTKQIYKKPDTTKQKNKIKQLPNIQKQIPCKLLFVSPLCRILFLSLSLFLSKYHNTFYATNNYSNTLVFFLCIWLFLGSMYK